MYKTNEKRAVASIRCCNSKPLAETKQTLYAGRRNVPSWPVPVPTAHVNSKLCITKFLPLLFTV